MHAYLLSHIWLWESLDCGPPGSSVHGFLRARILQWVAMPSSRRLSRPRNQALFSCVFCIAGRFFTYCTVREAPKLPCDPAIPLLGTYTEKNVVWRDTGTPIFTAALFIRATTWKKPRWPLTEEQINMWYTVEYSDQFSSVAQSCLALCDPFGRYGPQHTRNQLVHHQLLEFTQTHVHWVGDAIQPSHPLSSPSPPPTFNLSQHQGLFKCASSSHQVAKVLEFQLQHQSFQ